MNYLTDFFETILKGESKTYNDHNYYTSGGLRGFIEGGLLFYPGSKPDGSSAMPVLNPKTKTYDFKPNITTFHIPQDSDLGTKIKSAKVMVAATGFYDKLGDGSESRYPNAEEFLLQLRP